jgi:hypothetical protein
MPSCEEKKMMVIERRGSCLYIRLKDFMSHTRIDNPALPSSIRWAVQVVMTLKVFVNLSDGGCVVSLIRRKFFVRELPFN